MSRKLINYLLIVLGLAIIIIIVRDFVVHKSGKNIENPYEYQVDEFRKVDPSLVLYHEVKNFPVNASDLKGIAVADSQVVIVAANLLLKYDFNGKELSRKPIIDTATCVTVDPYHQVWIGLRHTVVMYDVSGTLVKRWNSFGNRSFITSLAVSGEDVYVADAGNRMVYHCNTTGQVLRRIGEKDEEKGVPGFVIPSPYFSVALDDNKFLWVVNPGMHSLENYNADGSMRTSWAASSFKIDGFSGCCNPAYMVMMDDNSFVTSEKGMPRIKLYDQHGVFKGVVAPPDAFDENSSTAPAIALDARQRVVALDIERKQVRIFERKENENN
jgi:hypothetical protein